MTHEDAGNYAAKHPAGTAPDPTIADAVREDASEGSVSCAAAHAIAGDLGVSPAEIGRTIDLLQLRIVKCQMGLFGYHPRKKIVEPATSITPELRDAITTAATNGRIPCLTSWEIAGKFHLPKMAVAAACEALGIKIGSCQLGAF